MSKAWWWGLAARGTWSDDPSMCPPSRGAAGLPWGHGGPGDAPPELSASPQVMGGQGVSGLGNWAANVELGRGGDVRHCHGMGVGPRDQDVKPPKLQNTFLGMG